MSEPPVAYGRSFSLITKVTRICNLRCPYCNEWEATKDVMSFRTLAALTKRALEHPDARSVQFIWHGGEPLVRGREFYDRALTLQRMLRRDGQQVRNAIQTNGTLVTAEWARYFAEHRWDVGLSLDGPKELHDAQRPRIGRRGSWDAAMRALRLFQEHDVGFGVLSVATPETLELGADAIFDFMAEHGVRSFAMLHLRPPSLPDGTYDPEADYLHLRRFNEFQQRLFDRWYEQPEAGIEIREFSSIVASLLGGRASVCTLAGHCIGRHFGVNVNGDVYHCDRYVTDDDYLLGNVRDTSFAEIFESDAVRALRSRNEARIEGYDGCRWKDVCHGGCPHDAYISQRSSSLHDPGCCGNGSLIGHIERRVAQDLAAAKELAAPPLEVSRH